MDLNAYRRAGMLSRRAIVGSLFFMLCGLRIVCGQTPLPQVSFYYSDKGFGETSSYAFLGIACDRPPVTVRLEYSGTATPNVDYTDSLGTIPTPAVRTIFMPESSAMITFTGRKDFIEEPNESLVVRILPDPSYIINAPGGATFAITNQISPPNIPPRIQFLAFTNLVLSRANISISAIGWDVDGMVGRAEIYTNGQLFRTIVPQGFARTNAYSVVWTNLPAGIFQMTASVFDDLGASGTTVPVTLTSASAVLAPAAGASVTPSNAAPGFNSILTGFNRRAVLEWEIPQSATNLQGFVRFQSATLTLHQRLWIYEASGAAISPAILEAPREFVASVAHGVSGFVTFDLTPWVQRLAGRRLGLILETDLAEQFPNVSRSGTQGFNSFSLILLPADSYEIPPRIRWLDFPRQVPYGSTIAMRGEILAPGWTDLSVVVADEWGPVANATIDQRGDLTNIFSATLTNFSAGPHYIRAIAYHDATNYAGEVGIVFVPLPDLFPHDYIQTTAASGSFMIVDRAGRAHVWGRNNEGQLGLGFHSVAPVSTPVTLLAPEGKRWKGIASGGRYSAGFTEDGSYWSWGSLAPTGPTGATGEMDIPTFGEVFPDSGGVAKIIAADNRSLFLDQKGRLMAYANGGISLYRSGSFSDVVGNSTNLLAIYNDRVGDLFTNAFPPPAGRNWKAISTAGNHSLALTSAGELYAWGQNGNGELPFSGVADAPTLATIPGVNAWTQIVAGNFVNLAVDDHGSLWAWGGGITGALDAGLNKPGKVSVPRDIRGWLDIAVSDSTAMALAEDGRFFVWGNPEPGILSNKSASPALFPEKIATFPNVADADAQDMFVSFVPATNQLSGGIQIISSAGVNLPIQASADLEHWTTITNLASPTGIIEWTAPWTSENRFYRVRSD